MNTQALQTLKSAKPGPRLKNCTDATFETHSGKSLKINVLRDSVHKALHAVNGATHLCIAAGQLLNEAQESLEHGEFKPFIEKYLPEISYDTANRWARAAANIVKALPPPTIDLAVSDILITPEQDLPPEARKYKQSWFDFTADKTINQCLNDVCVEGDKGHRVDRAINGKLKGGTRGEDRKDFPFFIGVKFMDLANHFSHWKKFNPTQKAEVAQIIRGAILGMDVSLPRGSRPKLFDFAGTKRKRGLWPRELCELALAALKERLKQEDES